MTVSDLYGEPEWDVADVTLQLINRSWRDALAGDLLEENADKSEIDAATNPVYVSLRNEDDEGRPRKGLTNVQSRDYIVIAGVQERGQEFADVTRATEDLNASALVTVQTPEGRERGERLYREMRHVFKENRDRWKGDLARYKWDTLDVTDSQVESENYGWWVRTFTFRYTALSRDTEESF